MADEEDSFIREVNEELRRENARALWGRYGPILIGGAALLVLATAAWQGYVYWQDSKAARIGGAMVRALTLAGQDNYEMSQEILEEVRASDFGAYPVLASFRHAALLAQQGEVQAAVLEFDALANDTKTPEILKNMALLRAAYLLVDHGTFADVEARVKSLATDTTAPARIGAQEALGLAAWKAENWDEARAYFERIVADEAAMRTGFQVRARQMLELLKERVP